MSPKLPVVTMIQFHSDNHSGQVNSAFQNRSRCEVFLVGNDKGGLNSDSLWIVSPFVRSIIGSLNNVEENLLILPDFCNKDIETALEIIERKNKDREHLVFFNSATKHLLETLRIDITKYEAASIIKVEKEDEDRTDVELVQEMLLAENADFDSSDDDEEADNSRVTVEEFIPEQNIKVEKTDEDLHEQLASEKDLSESDENIIRPLQNDLNRVFDKFMENFLPKGQNHMDENNLEKKEDNRECVEETDTDTDRTLDQNSTDLQEQKLQEVEDLLIRENRVWKCKECNKSFQTKFHTRTHAELHVQGLKYSCNQCDQIFPARAKLKSHKHRYHRLIVEEGAELSYPCGKCSENFKTRTSRQKHKWLKHKGNTAGKDHDAADSMIEPKVMEKDTERGENEKNSNDLRQQKLKEIEELLIEDCGRWKCKNCQKTFTKRITLVYHAENHVSGLSYLCKYCSETFNTRLKLYRHRQENHKDIKEGGKVEDAADRENIDDGKLKEVAKIREFQTDKSESDGGPVSSTTELIPRDINREISEKIKKLVDQRSDTEWRCIKCSKTFTRKSNLLNHLETHLNYSHSCPQCNFNSAARRALKIHYRVTHQNIK